VSKLQAAVQLPVLFMGGGSKDDYKAVLIKQLSAAAGCVLTPFAMSLCNHVLSMKQCVVWPETFSCCYSYQVAMQSV